MAIPETNQKPIEEKKEPEAPAEEAEEKPEESPEEVGISKIGNLLSPEAVIIFPLAILLDLIGIILILFVLDDFGITDIFGIILIGGWMFLRSGTVAVPERAKKRAEKGLAKLFRGSRWARYLTPIIGELIPYVGALPFWTIAVYYELTS